MMFEGNRFSRKGYLYKNFVMSAILSEGVKPTLAELEKFEEAPEGMSIEVAAGEKEEMHNFTNGDRVEVIEGELLNLQGTVTKIEGTKITIMPKHDDLKEALEFQSNELKKYFAQVRKKNISCIIFNRQCLMEEAVLLLRAVKTILS